MSDDLVFSDPPVVRIGGNEFWGMPVLLQYEDQPLIEIVRTTEPAGFTTQFSIYSPDGIYLAKVKGSRIFCTEDGKAVGLEMEYPDKMTVCKLNGKTVFEMHRTKAAALDAYAELFTPGGVFLKVTPHELIPHVLGKGKDYVSLGRCVWKDSVCYGARIGFLVRKNGALAFGAG